MLAELLHVESSGRLPLAGCYTDQGEEVGTAVCERTGGEQGEQAMRNPHRRHRTEIHMHRSVPTQYRYRSRPKHGNPHTCPAHKSVFRWRNPQPNSPRQAQIATSLLSYHLKLKKGNAGVHPGTNHLRLPTKTVSAKQPPSLSSAYIRVRPSRVTRMRRAQQRWAHRAPVAHGGVVPLGSRSPYCGLQRAHNQNLGTRGTARHPRTRVQHKDALRVGAECR